MTLVAPRYTSTEKKQSSCAQWYIGSECSSTSSASMPPSIAQLTYCAISDRLDSITPLGRDSVPDVYMSRSGSSSPTGTSGGVSGPAVHQASTSSQPSPAASPDSGIQPRTPPVTPAVLSAFSAVGASASSATIPLAPECVRMKAISSGPSMKLTGTSTIPSYAVAKTSTAYCHELWLSSASRSPLARPRSARTCAVRLTAASNSAYVNRRSPATTASLS